MSEKFEQKDVIKLLDFERMRQEGRFAEFILLSWAMIESYVDLAIRLEFDVGDDELKADFLTERSFHFKLEFLKHTEFLDKIGYESVMAFAQERNKLFHGKVDSEIPSFLRTLLDKPTQENVMGVAEKAMSFIVKLVAIKLEKLVKTQDGMK